MKIDIVIITALQKELDAILRQGDWEEYEGYQDSIRTYYVLKNNAGPGVAAVQANGMGPLNAALVASDALRDLSPSKVILVGIAAAINKGVKLGDIVVSQQVIDYDLGKVRAEDIERRFTFHKSDAPLVARINAFRSREWEKRITVLRPDQTPHSAVIVHSPADIYSGSKVIADANFLAALLRNFPKTIAAEMECGGVAAALDQATTKRGFIMIKGICDRGDAGKNDLWQDYAADVAAAYTMAFVNTLRDVYTDPATIERDIQKEVRHIVDLAATSAGHVSGYKIDLALTIGKDKVEEINSVMSPSYHANLAHGRQFLMRAEAIFGQAKAIYATSLDTVSTFWTNPANRDAARQYLEHQKGTAKRLFVFSDADSAHKHAIVLDAHEEAYGSVFICSMVCYWALLNRIAARSSPAALKDRDFAVLRHEQGQDMKYLFAELDEQTLTTTDLPSLESAGKIDHKKFVNFFEQAESINHGERGTEFNIFRWEKEIWKKDSTWEGVLRKLFEERESDVLHLISFNFQGRSDAQIRELLAMIKGAVLKDSGTPSMQREYGIKHVWFGKRTPCLVKDHLHQGHLRMADQAEDPYILTMQFDTASGLKRFYEDRAHAALRRTLYEQLDTSVSQLYQVLDSGRRPKESEAIGESIEATMSKYMARRDYQNIEMIREMLVCTAPFPF